MKNASESAYPQATTEEVMGQFNKFAAVVSRGGLTKRELFAGMAMRGLVVSMFPTDPKAASDLAVMHADALLAELAKERP